MSQGDAELPATPKLRATRLRLHTQHQAVVIMRTDCHVCRSEGLASRSQVLVSSGGREVQATLFQIEGDDLLAIDQIALTETTWKILSLDEDAAVTVTHAPTLESLASVRRRIYGNRLDAHAVGSIVRDVAARRYTDVHLAAFLTASAALPLDEQETIDLTGAMVDVGERLHWDSPIVLDKHCIGGLPGNRTTPIVVAIVAACGLVIPKTSSRAITSPAGTADTMETLAPVDLDIATLRRVVEAEGGCIAWGGAMHLSPADDIFVRIERELDVDTEGQLIASVLSKKIAAGSTHVVIDIPVGATAKVRGEASARHLAERISAVAARFGLSATCLLTDGSQPVGRGIGPALEALDVLAVLRSAPDAPDDLRRRAAALAGAALEIGGKAAKGEGAAAALATLADGRAWRKFQAICAAQGGMRTPPRASHIHPLIAPRAGRIVHINNRKLARLAKLAGAPEAKAAGVYLNVSLGQEIDKAEALLDIHAESAGELAYALEYARRSPDIIEVELSS
ncbi:thymidine phosphorylase [Parvibaculum indicum]|uniref:thymidine phosphorylase family protein n=1 Tax=Parvibaculum indicum TaxID=562969 RepID=UPI00141D8115|nr:thymidine phosphorylase family protein [Parvibaculum indicum]MBC7138585.1 thymidine phosphorylase family protein [Defluviimonas sp.]NIJ43185.1 thymidine phosphorylase [Parvibaculum indicum]